MPNTGLGSLAISDAYDPVEDLSPFRNRTKDVIEIFCRRIANSENEGGIQKLGVGFEGQPGKGKSTTVKLIIEILREHYGKENVWAVMVKCNPNYIRIPYRMMREASDRPVNIFVFEDALFLMETPPQQAILKSWLANFRHEWEDEVEYKTKKKPLVGLPSYWFTFQERYDMNSRVRNYLDVQMNFDLGSERWYIRDAINTYGEEGVEFMFRKKAAILAGDYKQIGYGVVLCPFKGSKLMTTGWIYFPLKKDKDMSDELFFDVIIDLEKEMDENPQLRSKVGGGKKQVYKALVEGTFAGLDGFIAEKFWQDQELSVMFNSPVVYSKNGDELWKCGQVIAGKRISLEFAVKERIRLIIWKNYYGWDDEKLLEEANKLRSMRGIEEIGDRTINVYIFTSFFKKVSLASNRLGQWLEEFVHEQLEEYLEIMIAELQDEIRLYYIKKSTSVQELEVLLEKLKRTLISLGGFGGCDLAFSLGDQEPVLLLNVKNQLVRKGGFEPTPEKAQAKDHQCSFGILYIEAHTKGKASLRYQSWQEKSGSVPSKFSSQDLRYIDSWREILDDYVRLLGE